MPTQSSDPSGDALLNLITGHRVTAIIHVAAKLALPISSLKVRKPPQSCRA
jgi:hypothetical protein